MRRQQEVAPAYECMKSLIFSESHFFITHNGLGINCVKNAQCLKSSNKQSTPINKLCKLLMIDYE